MSACKQLARHPAARGFWWGAITSASLLSALALVEPAGSAERGEVELEASILRAKPGVVLISSEVGAEMTVRCGSGAPRAVSPDSRYETGSGFIIHPDGYIATNGHVVANYYEMNERELADEFLMEGIATACGSSLAALSEPARQARLRAIAADPDTRRSVRVTKKLQVHLSTGKIYAAHVRAYSPAIKSEASTAGTTGGRDMGPMERSGKDVAILTIAETNLPTVRLASGSTALQLGEQIFILGYPGVVLNHDFLSQRSALEASVTVGRVSGFKFDITDRRVIQTDTSISWGNSGGPAFNRRGEVIGAATFISTTLDGDQAVQGFNFLIPVESIHEFARSVSLMPTAESPFTRKWEQAVASYFGGNYRAAARTLEDAERIMPGFPDLMRLHLEAQMRGEREARFGGVALAVGVSAGAVALVLLTVGIRSIAVRRGWRATTHVRRTSPQELRGRLDAGSAVTLLDARRSATFDESPVQAAGALRYDIDRPSLQTLQVQVERNGEVVAYCDCPDEATSTQVALQLLRAGYERVSVVRGGFQALMDAGVPMAPKALRPAPAAGQGTRPEGRAA